MIDKPLPLAGGGTVQLYNLIVFATPSGAKNLSIQYGTSLPPDARESLVREAGAVATQLKEFAAGQGIVRGTAQICRTRGQAEAREAISEIIPIERAPDGSWRAVDDAGFSAGGA
jgi:hypothetical protein